MHRIASATLAAAGALGLAVMGWSASSPISAAPRAEDALLPIGDGIDRAAIDTRTSPCTDFYQHACGGFIAAHRPTAERPVVSLAQMQFDTDLQHGLDRLLAEQAKDPELRRLQTFYSSCRTATANDDPVLRAWLRRIDAANDRQAIQRVIRDLAGIGVDAFINFGGRPDRTDLHRYRGEIHSGSLWADEPVVAATFAAAGDSPASAARDAAAVAAITNVLRKQRNDRWDASKSENPRSWKQLRALAPAFEWDAYLAQAGASPGRAINVTSPQYLRDLNDVLRTRSPQDLKAYLRWSLLFSLRGELPQRYDAALARLPINLRPELHDVGARCRNATVRALGVEFSRQYSHRILGVPARQTAARLSETIRAEIIRSIADHEWLSPRARSATVDKLRRTDLKIGFPDFWPAVGHYPLAERSFMANVLAARRFEQRREWSRAAKQRSRFDWEMKVDPWVGEGMAAARLVIPNGFPDAFSNSLIMTAAFLTAPRFDNAAAPELNYATYGSVFAHEFVHVAQLHMFGPEGEARELWDGADEKAADARGQCMIDEANKFEALPRTKLPGAEEFPENVADSGGLRLAYQALARSLGAAIDRRDSRGISPAQRFFYRYAQYHCTAQTDASLRESIANDSHAPPAFRVNGPLTSLPEFQRAFSCPMGSPMTRPPAKQCRVW